jgi:hypothetical protein
MRCNIPDTEQSMPLLTKSKGAIVRRYDMTALACRENIRI